MNEEPPYQLVITPEQKEEGWLERIGCFIQRQDYVVIRKVDKSNNYVVINPAWLMWKNKTANF